jgi:uncharacterized membrane protein SpoIIM required for sporulation
MKQERFEREHQEAWAGFAAMLAGVQPERLPEAYRALCRDLALARQRCYSAALVARLEALAMAGHQALYRSSLDLAPRWGQFLAGGLARSVRALAAPVLVAVALLGLPAALLPPLIAHRPNLAYVLEDPATLEKMEAMYQPRQGRFGRVGQAQTDLAMFGFYVWNNVRICFQAFAGGILFGLGSALYLLHNGIHGGAVAGHLTQVGLGRQFWPFVCTHSALELPALALAGGAGLHLGWALLAPGRRSRRRALAEAARDGIPVVYGAAAMTVLAAAIEAFWSASGSVPVPAKLTAGALLWAGVASYFLLAGRRRA